MQFNSRLDSQRRASVSALLIVLFAVVAGSAAALPALVSLP
jgi:hypothetical protein